MKITQEHHVRQFAFQNNMNVQIKDGSLHITRKDASWDGFRFNFGKRPMTFGSKSLMKAFTKFMQY